MIWRNGPLGAGRSGSPRSAWQTAGTALFLLVLIGACVALGTISGSFFRIFARLGESGGWLLTLAILAYLFSHLLRALRLAMLAGSHEVSLRRLTLVHFFTAGVSLLLPFKLGEAYRVLELRTVIGSMQRSLLTVWIERGFDVGALVLLMVCAVAWSGTGAVAMLPLAGVSAAFIVLTGVAFVVLPENLQALSLFIIRRYRTERAVVVLRVVHTMLTFLRHGQRIIRGKYAVVSTISALIWLLELASFGLVLNAAGSVWASALDGFLRYVSATSVGYVAFSEQSFTFVESTLENGVWTMASQLITYGIVMRTSLLAVACLAGLIYAPGRLSEETPVVPRRA
ncbi:flippase-like domain-containing protein [Ralstonia pickettii]|uniref:lysylphosphatidylglycerol synthase domain-containing protein n=1 Tax=Ralstonia pickettii TaxID=329 RepID=UPI002715050B|nr:lysylphosphatidylglycerol synthase domain-containing protein [Ralstonia pickettii]WKZ85932.1 flippase-like domain-containing protein [Ralstonia pickettii]